MSRHLPPASPALHLHIRRLVVDADALGAERAPRDLDARLQAALSSRLGGESGARADGPHWIEAIADTLAARVRDAVPMPEPGR